MVIIGEFFSSNKSFSTVHEFMLIRRLLLGPSIALGWGLVTRKTKTWLVDRKFKSGLHLLHLNLREGEKDCTWPGVTNGQWVNQSCLHSNGTSIKTPKWRDIKNFLVGELVKVLERRYAQGECESSILLPNHALPVHLPLGCSWVASFIINQ